MRNFKREHPYEYEQYWKTPAERLLHERRIIEKGREVMIHLAEEDLMIVSQSMEFRHWKFENRLKIMKTIESIRAGRPKEALKHLQGIDEVMKPKSKNSYSRSIGRLAEL